MTYLIATESFPTKREITDRCRAILAVTPDGVHVAEEATPFLFAIFQFHDEWNQKTTGGVVNITTQTTPHGTRCFALVKLSGEQIDISFPHAIRLIPSPRSETLLPQALRDFRNAARVAIKPQIFDFRDRELKQERCCPFTGEPLSRATCSVDHTPPRTFDQLLFDFCVQNSVNPLVVAVGSEEGTIPVLNDKNLLTAWQQYHQENADLRILSKIGNLQLPKVVVHWSELWS